MGNPIIPVSSFQEASPFAHAKDAFAPAKPILSRMLAFHASFGKAGDDAAHHMLDSLEHERSHLQGWTKKQMDHMVAVANRTWVEHGWSTLKTVAECVVSVVSFAMGGYLLAHGNTTEGNALITLGIFNILQTVFARHGMWDWITETLAERNETYRDKLKMAFPIIVSLLSIGFSIAGSRLSQNLQPTNLYKRLQQAQSAIAVGSQGMSAYLTFKRGVDDAKSPEIQGELYQSQQNIDLLTRFLESLMKEVRRVKSTIKKPINALMQAATLASQKV